MTKQWYEELYEDFGKHYDNEPYVHETVREVDFIEREIDFDRNKRVLDVGCGTGRHPLELARRGYRVTGVDLSRSMLDRGRLLAEKEGLSVVFRELDARNLDYEAEFEVVLSICEGAFSLMETDEMDRQILLGIARALKPKGKFILTTGSAAYQLAQNNEAFDIVTLREKFTLVKPGSEAVLSCQQRYYTCPELRYLLFELGFSKVEFFGDFDRNSPLTRDEFNMLVVAKK